MGRLILGIGGSYPVSTPTPENCVSLRSQESARIPLLSRLKFFLKDSWCQFVLHEFHDRSSLLVTNARTPEACKHEWWALCATLSEFLHLTSTRAGTDKFSAEIKKCFPSKCVWILEIPNRSSPRAVIHFHADVYTAKIWKRFQVQLESSPLNKNCSRYSSCFPWGFCAISLRVKKQGECKMLKPALILLTPCLFSHPAANNTSRLCFIHIKLHASKYWADWGFVFQTSLQICFVEIFFFFVEWASKSKLSVKYLDILPQRLNFWWRTMSRAVPVSDMSWAMNPLVLENNMANCWTWYMR